jgi:hypothetical protein
MAIRTGRVPGGHYPWVTSATKEADPLSTAATVLAAAGLASRRAFSLTCPDSGQAEVAADDQGLIGSIYHERQRATDWKDEDLQSLPYPRRAIDRPTRTPRSWPQGQVVGSTIVTGRELGRIALRTTPVSRNAEAERS